MNNIRFLIIGVGAMALLGTGCSTYKNQAKTMTSSWHTGDITNAAKSFAEKADKAGKGDAIVWHLEAGAAYRAVGDFTNSNRHFDDASAIVDQYEQEGKVKVASEAGAIMSNQQNLPYRGKPVDKIMLHTYKALNYLALGDIEKARPEVISAYQCQQDAVDANARRIEKAKEEEEQAKDKDKVEKAKNDPKVSQALAGATKELEGFKFYADYVNPFTVYLDGLYFLHAGSGNSDLEHASKSFARLGEVCGENRYVQADIVTISNAFNGQQPGGCTYVVFETGQGASLDQIRIDIPIVVTKVSYVGTAFPKLELHNGQAPNMKIKTSDGEFVTEPLANMDAIVGLDFKNEFPTIITKTIISTVTKAVATYAANKAAENAGGSIAGWASQIGTAVYGLAVNIADTRSWTTLPKEIQIARIPTPADRKLTISTPTGGSQSVNLLDGTVVVAYAKSITASGPLFVNQFKLK